MNNKTLSRRTKIYLRAEMKKKKDLTEAEVTLSKDNDENCNENTKSKENEKPNEKLIIINSAKSKRMK